MCRRVFLVLPLSYTPLAHWDDFNVKIKNAAIIDGKMEL